MLLTLLIALGGCSDAPSEVAASKATHPTEQTAPSPAAPARPLPPGTLLMVSERGGGPQVWAVDIDGKGARQVVAIDGAESHEGHGHGGTFPGEPDPQGTHALVIQTADGEQGHRESLWLVGLEDGERIRLTPDFSRVRNPTWAPDGSWIAFESDEFSYGDIYRVSREGGARTRLTSAEHGTFEPDISPDGARVLGGSSRDGNAEIYVFNADGSAPRRLTHVEADDTAPSWSPDGKSIAWISDQEGMPRVWLMGADGDGQRPLRPVPDTPALDLTYAWSPDGQRIAIAVQTGPRQVDLRIVDVQSGRELAILDGEGVTEHPAWSPDGEWIAFSSNRDGDTEVYVATADGAQVHRVTRSPGPDWLPRWLPAR